MRQDLTAEAGSSFCVLVLPTIDGERSKKKLPRREREERERREREERERRDSERENKIKVGEEEE